MLKKTWFTFQHLILILGLNYNSKGSFQRGKTLMLHRPCLTLLLNYKTVLPSTDTVLSLDCFSLFSSLLQHVQQANNDCIFLTTLSYGSSERQPKGRNFQFLTIGGNSRGHFLWKTFMTAMKMTMNAMGAKTPTITCQLI